MKPNHRRAIAGRLPIARHSPLVHYNAQAPDVHSAAVLPFIVIYERLVPAHLRRPVPSRPTPSGHHCAPWRTTREAEVHNLASIMQHWIFSQPKIVLFSLHNHTLLSKRKHPTLTLVSVPSFESMMFAGLRSL